MMQCDGKLRIQLQRLAKMIDCFVVVFAQQEVGSEMPVRNRAFGEELDDACEAGPRILLVLAVSEDSSQFVVK